MRLVGCFGSSIPAARTCLPHTHHGWCFDGAFPGFFAFPASPMPACPSTPSLPTIAVCAFETGGALRFLRLSQELVVPAPLRCFILPPSFFETSLLLLPASQHLPLHCVAFVLQRPTPAHGRRRRRKEGRALHAFLHTLPWEEPWTVWTGTRFFVIGC